MKNNFLLITLTSIFALTSSNISAVQYPKLEEFGLEKFTIKPDYWENYDYRGNIACSGPSICFYNKSDNLVARCAYKTPDDCDSLYVEALEVVSGSQNQKNGSKIFKYFLAYAAKNYKVKTVKWSIRPIYNDETKVDSLCRFYKRLGATIIDSGEGYYISRFKGCFDLEKAGYYSTESLEKIKSRL